MKPVMILAGGTGGHVFPALAIANELQGRGVPIVWVGTENGIEAKLVPAAGFPLLTVHIQGIRRKGLLQYLSAPVIITRALSESIRIVVKQKPCVLLGMGGFVAGPCALVGVLLRKPLIIHEQNSVLGLTNRILAPICKKMFTGFPIVENNKKVEFCGNPVREDLRNIEEPDTRLAARTGPKRILIIGGSQGAAALNQIVPPGIEKLSASIPVDIWHQTGKGRMHEVTTAYKKFNSNARVSEFVEDMAEAYQWADLIICRSGAITLAEIAAVGLAAVLVPYPYAVDDHQTSNASRFVAAGAAYLIPESDLNADKLSELLAQLVSDTKQLVSMARAAKRLNTGNASQKIADECMLLGGLATVAGAA